MNRKLQPARLLLVLCLVLTTVTAAGQQSVYRDTIVLRTPPGELIRFQSGDMVISIDRTDLLKKFEPYGRKAECEAIFPAGATVNLSAASDRIDLLFEREYRLTDALDFIIATCLENGDARVHSDLAGNDLPVIVLEYYNYYPASGLRRSVFKQPATNTAFFSYEVVGDITEPPGF